MEIQFQWRPRKHFAFIVHFAERFGWRNSIFVQILGFCVWIYWNKRDWRKINNAKNQARRD